MVRSSLMITIALCFCLPLLAQTRNSNSDIGNKQAAAIQWLLSRGKTIEQKQPDSGDYYFKKATALAFASKNVKLISSCMAENMKLLNEAAKFEKGLSVAQQHIASAKLLQVPSVLMQAYNEAANEYEYLGDYQPATEYYLKALKLATDIGDKKMQRMLNNNLASVFLALKDYATGYTYAVRAYRMSQMEKDTVTMANCLVNMGIAELNQKEYDQALSHFDEAEKTGYRIQDMTLVADALSDKGLLYLTTHNLNAAAASYQKQKSIAEEFHLPYEKMYSLFQLALVAKEKNNLSEANKYASAAITIGEQVGTADELMEMYDSMAAIKQKIGDYKSALFYKTRYETISDSLTNQQIQTNIHHLNIQYHTAQKDKQIAEQNLSIEKNKAAIQRKNFWIFVSLGGILALILILILSLRSYRHKQKLHQQQLLTLQKQHEVTTLKAKMQAREEERDRIAREMHDDIGSALTTILYLSDDLKTEHKDVSVPAGKIATTASAVVDKMNEIIWSMNPNYDTLSDLIAYTRQHCAEFLGDHHLHYQLNIPETFADLHLSGEQRRNIYLVIKEALHNIVKHASATNVTICFQFTEKSLEITIHDNGKGFQQESRFGNGLNNMRHRMEMIGGGFEIANEDGTKIKIVCPIQAEVTNAV